ncbi:MAG: GFA family protein [Burkholderiaceae bacterium]|jgi:hypothetical protein|nr:GFA family protein [Burkholderiaceae bacterium]
MNHQQHASETSPDTRHTGSCLCGGVRFVVHGTLEPIQVCHCGQCRKAQGGPLATNIPVAADQMEWIAGRDLLRHFESSPGKLRAFCGTCGAPVYSQRAGLPGVLRVRAGLLDQPLQATLAFHQQVASRAQWWPLQDDGLPQFEGAAGSAQKQDNR